MGDEGGVDGMSAGQHYVGAIRGSHIVSNAADVLEINVVRGMKGVGRVSEMCLVRGGVADEAVSG